MFIAMRKLFSTLSAAVGVIIASVYLSAPLIAKFGNVKEQYMIAFMVMGISCLVLYQLGGEYVLFYFLYRSQLESASLVDVAEAAAVPGAVSGYADE